MKKSKKSKRRKDGMDERKERKVFRRRKKNSTRAFKFLLNNVQFINERNSWKMNHNFKN